MQTQIFDIFVMKLHKWLVSPHKNPETLTHDLTFLLQLLELRPYQTGRGFVFLRVRTIARGRREAHDIHSDTHRFEVPSGETTPYISNTMRGEMCHSFINPEFNFVD